MTREALYRQLAEDLGETARFYARYAETQEDEPFAYWAAVSAAHFGRLALDHTLLITDITFTA